jgi:phospholipid/cholesterol/gamma-HCH transport system substrate-binding protein
MASSSVTMNGLKIGNVKDISFMGDKDGSLLVSLSIDQRYDIPTQSIALISSMDLMGTKAIKILRTQNTDLCQNGDTLKGEIETDLAEEVSRQVMPLKNKAEKLMGSLDSVLIFVQQVFADGGSADIQRSISSLSVAIQAFERVSLRVDTLIGLEKSRLSSIIKSAESISRNLESNNKQISKILTNTAIMSDSLSKVSVSGIIHNAESSLKQLNRILDKVDRGEGTLGALLNNDTLYQNLERSSRDLDYLLIDVRNNPKKYVRFSLFDRGNKYVLDEKSMDNYLDSQAKKTEKPDK